MQHAVTHVIVALTPHVASLIIPARQNPGVRHAPIQSPLGLVQCMKRFEQCLVVELADSVAGSYAGTRLADLGARVAKFEPLTGDPQRAEAELTAAGGGCASGSRVARCDTAPAQSTGQRHL
ncbi:MAG: CoA transferase [Dehalococcoidia bacterium]